MGSTETSVRVVARHFWPALILCGAGLAINTDLETTFLIQLALLAAWLWWTGAAVIRSIEVRGPWYPGLGRRADLWAGAATVVSLITFATLLLTLASSAALRFDPSTQFLQLLSALDIAWVVTGFMFGLSLKTGSSTWRTAGLAMAVVCVWSIVRYIGEVGFGPEGEWIVNGSELMRLVIPFDVAAAVMTLAAITWGTAAQPIAQPSDQS